MPSSGRIYLDGASRKLTLGGYAGRELVPGGSADAGSGLPYLFCANGSCRDCNALVEGLEDVPTCRVPLAPGLSIRRGEGAGDENALARRLEPFARGEAIVADVVVIGGGRAGREAAAERRRRGRRVRVLDARGPQARPVAVVSGQLCALESVRLRPIEADEVVLATGSRDVVPPFPGGWLPGVLPMDLLERYAALGFLPGRRFLLVGDAVRTAALALALTALDCESVARWPSVGAAEGDARVRKARRSDGSVDVDIVALAVRREPALSLPRALGCRIRYDGRRGHDVLEVDASGRTSVSGVRAVGSLAGR